jgi:hypothetical protein
MFCKAASVDFLLDLIESQFYLALNKIYRLAYLKEFNRVWFISRYFLILDL